MISGATNPPASGASPEPMTACGRRWPVHPAAVVFPLIDGEPFEQLGADIRVNGLREPITLHPDGRLLDGRNRLRACDVAGVTPLTRTWNGEGSAVAYVVSLNLHRRHLDESQRALVAARIANLPRGANQHSPIGESSTQSDAAALLNIGKRSVERARDVIARGAPELVKAVERGAISVSAAKQATTLPTSDQQAVVARVDAGERPVDVIRDVARAARARDGQSAKGRPPRVEDQPTERLVTYVTQAEKASIERAAAKNLQSISAYARVVLCEAADECGEDVPESLHDERRKAERRKLDVGCPVELERRTGSRRT